MALSTVFPAEIFLKIFSYLDYDDLLAIKNVNQEFGELVSYLVSNRTVTVKHSGFYSLFDRLKLFNCDDVCVYYEQCLVSKSLIAFCLNRDLHSKIRRLIIHDPFLLSNSTTYENLEHLELITNSETTTIKNDLILKAQNLRTLNVQLSGKYPDLKDVNFKLILISPILKYLKTDYSLVHFRFFYPKSVQLLNCTSNDSSVNQFKNLSRLVCYEFDPENVNMFNDLACLEEFSFYYTKVCID